MKRSRIVALGILVGVGLSAPAPAVVYVLDNVPGAFIDISTTGTPLGLTDEGVAEVIPGFPLTQTFFGGGGGKVWISNNGALGFLVDGSAGAYYLNGTLPSFSLFGAGHAAPQALAVYWDDLDADTGDVYCETVGTPGDRVFIVQWQDRPHYPGDSVLDGDEVTFQVQIFENPTTVHAQFVYADVDFLDPALSDGASATIGYQDAPGMDHVTWGYNTAGAVSAGTVLSVIVESDDCPDRGDMDGDCHIDRQDYRAGDACLQGPGLPRPLGCACMDMNADGSVDLVDFALFQAAFTGPHQTIPGCRP